MKEDNKPFIYRSLSKKFASATSFSGMFRNTEQFKREIKSLKDSKAEIEDVVALRNRVSELEQEKKEMSDRLDLKDEELKILKVSIEEQRKESQARFHALEALVLKRAEK